MTALVHKNASRNPNIPPRPASSKLSVSNWRIMRPAAGSKAGAQRKLARAAHGARQQQTGDVGAGDEQQEADRGEQHEEEGLDVATMSSFMDRRAMPTPLSASG